MPIYTPADMLAAQKFEPYYKFDSAIRNNCIGFGLGIHLDDPSNSVFGSILAGNTIAKLKELFRNLNFSYRRITSENQLQEDEYGIVLYKYACQILYTFPFRFLGEGEEIHLARIERDSDGNWIWVERIGHCGPIEVTSDTKIRSRIQKEDGVEVEEPLCMFAVKVKASHWGAFFRYFNIIFLYL